MENKRSLLIYDIGELGWSLPLAAHVNYLLVNKIEEDIVVCTYRPRYVLYNGLKVKLIEIPGDLLIQQRHLSRDGTHLYDGKKKFQIDNNTIYRLLSEHFGNQYTIYKKYGQFFGERIFYSFTPSDRMIDFANRIIGNKKVILVFPRVRPFKFGERNAPEDFYISLCKKICNEFEDKIIISLGSIKESYHLEKHINYENFLDLTLLEDKDKLDLLIAFCTHHYAEYAIGTQSSLPKISLLCKVPTFMIGDERKRHTEYDNWFSTEVGFFDARLSDDGYIFNYEECINDFIEFVKGKKYKSTKPILFFYV